MSNNKTLDKVYMKSLMRQEKQYQSRTIISNEKSITKIKYMSADL